VQAIECASVDEYSDSLAKYSVLVIAIDDYNGSYWQSLQIVC
jgi:hypothetical protein